MKRIILCMLACLLLLTYAAAEDCAHENLLMCSMRSAWEDVDAGHRQVYTKSCVCDDCSQSIVSKTYGALTGHTFHMSESIHFAAEELHLWVFVCPDCLHITLMEEKCAGGDACLLFSAQAGERPPVQQGESIAAYRALTKDDYIRRWIAYKKTI